MGIGTEPELYSKNFIRCSGVNCLRTSTSLPRVSNTRALFVARCVVNSWMCLSFSAILKNPREHDAPHSLLTHKETRNRCNNEEIIHLRYQKHLHAALFVVLVHRDDVIRRTYFTIGSRFCISLIALGRWEREKGYDNQNRALSRNRPSGSVSILVS